MKVYRAEQIRNVALISHGGSGKTSLVDAALYDSGLATRIGRVDDGSSISDSDPDEIKRRMSINLTVVPVEWQGTKINFLDTPGYADFVGEVMAALRVADAALVVVSAEKGVEVGTELVWKYANEYRLPRLVFVNKLDRENTSYDRALESLRSHFGNSVAPLTIPIGEQAALSGVVDLVSGKAYSFADDKAAPSEIPERHDRRRRALPRAAGRDRGRERRRPDGQVSRGRGDQRRASYVSAIKKGVAAGTLVPVLAGSLGQEHRHPDTARRDHRVSAQRR